jgi:hypothetical protein
MGTGTLQSALGSRFEKKSLLLEFDTVSRSTLVSTRFRIAVTSGAIALTGLPTEPLTPDEELCTFNVSIEKCNLQVHPRRCTARRIIPITN